MTARDRVGHVIEKDVELVVDRTPPALELTARARRFFRRDESGRIDLDLAVTVVDAFVQRVAAEIHVSGESPIGPIDLVRSGAAGDRTSWTGRARIPKPREFRTREPMFEIVYSAVDLAGSTSRAVETLSFEWETGDRLLWDRDGSTLVYHEAAPDAPGAFWMGETEVTNAQYQRFLDAQGGRYDWTATWWSDEARASMTRRLPLAPAWKGRDRCPEKLARLPVTNLNFHEARAYTAWAGLAIPTPEEWKAAALWDYERGAVFRRFPWGEEPRPDAIRAGDRETPVPVADLDGPWKRGRTPQGLWHVFGNASEFGFDRSVFKMGGAFDLDVSEFERPELREYICRDGVASASTPVNHCGIRCILRDAIR